MAASMAPLLYGAQPGACACSGDGRPAGRRKANRHFLPAHDRPGRSRHLCDLSSDPQSRRRARWAGPREKGPALPKLKTLLSNPATSWTKIVVSAWYGHVNGRTLIALYVRRWQIEVTFAETRAHLGVETQRQWSDQAIARTTPVLIGLYSLTSLCACDLLTTSRISYAAAWYRKTSLTFTDAIGAVRLKIWLGDINQRSPPHREPQNIPAPRLIRMAQARCFAA